MPRSPSRREAIQGLTAAAIGGALGCGRDEVSAPVVDTDPWDTIRRNVDVVVVLMMENRSFDHYLGALTLEEGRTDVDGLTSTMRNPRTDGSQVAPFPSSIDCVDDPPHSWTSCHAQFNEGQNDGFVTEFARVAPEVADHAMSYWGRDMLPVTYALADQFVICDAWFSSVLTSTWPNRYYVHCGTSAGIGDNSLPTADQDFASIYSRLTEAGRTWANFYLNLPSVSVLPDVDLVESRLLELERFFERAEAGTLPHYCFLDPLYGENDDHPPTHPLAGQILIAQIIDALARSPQWSRCLFLLTYDEHGGFFDHVPPGKTPDDHKRDGFDQRGFRVPTQVVGPWVKPGHVSHVVYDHASVLALLEALYELEPLAQRDAEADPMLDVFDLDALTAQVPHDPPALEPIFAHEDDIYREECTWLGIFRSSRVWPTGQPALEIFADAHLAGTRFDRRAQTAELRAWLLDRAVERDLLVVS